MLGWRLFPAFPLVQEQAAFQSLVLRHCLQVNAIETVGGLPLGEGIHLGEGRKCLPIVPPARPESFARFRALSYERVMQADTMLEEI